MFSYNSIGKRSVVTRNVFAPSRVLTKCPQKKGRVRQVRITTPRKPNSAKRKTVKLVITNKKKPVTYIPGKGHTLKKFSTVLIRGIGPRDLPGVYSRCIRGKFDLGPISTKTRRRSIYGVSRK
jgi:small subunit ribosomal protein S12